MLTHHLEKLLSKMLFTKFIHKILHHKGKPHNHVGFFFQNKIYVETDFNCSFRLLFKWLKLDFCTFILRFFYIISLSLSESLHRAFLSQHFCFFLLLVTKPEVLLKCNVKCTLAIQIYSLLCWNRCAKNKATCLRFQFLAVERSPFPWLQKCEYTHAYTFGRSGCWHRIQPQAKPMQTLSHLPGHWNKP